MPFDSLILRALTSRWQETLIGARIDRALAMPGQVWLIGRAGSEPVTLTVGLEPGLVRMHRTRRPPPPFARPIPWFRRLLPFTVRGLSTPAFERIVFLDIAYQDDWQSTLSARLVIELAGRLTNVIWLTPDHIVKDALKKIAAGGRGRAVWPGLPYVAPPVFPNPCESRNPEHLPPWAKMYREQEPAAFWDVFCEDWAAGRYEPQALQSPDGRKDFWVYPLKGWLATPIEDLDAFLDDFYLQEQERRLIQRLRSDLQARLLRRRRHLLEKRSLYLGTRPEEAEEWRELGDLWLAYQHEFQARPGLLRLAVPGLSGDGGTRILELKDGQSPAEAAQAAYRAYKKARGRHAAAQMLLPAVEKELKDLDQALEDLKAPHPAAWYQKRLTKTADFLPTQASQEFRRFMSQGGFPIWVGRNQSENHRLTFQKARPDDWWFHVKAAAGSHVLLMTGKKNPNLDDLLDAAQLAVFYSAASQSSHVAVDYTRRKFVKKRPHGEPGQVLYQREKTLYVSPDPDRLRRLGAMREKLVDDP